MSAIKEKKSKAAPKVQRAKTAKTASHPPYFEMIKDALLALNEKSGSSPYAIAKYMEEKHKSVLPTNFRKILGLQLKNSATKGKLNKIKASYKLSESGKKNKVAASKPSTKKADPKKSRTTVGSSRKAEGAKKVVPKKKKKATPVKPKQPKSIKSPAAKKAKKSVAA